MLGRMAATDDVAALRVLGDAVRPVGLGVREEAAERAGVAQTSAVPLNRLVDAVAARERSRKRIRARGQRTRREQFQRRGSSKRKFALSSSAGAIIPARLQPLLDNSALLKELAPVSQSLASLGAAGLQALDYLDKGERASDAWKTQTLAMIDQAAKPQADLLIAVAPAVQLLVNASAGALPAK